ncbi:MAG: Asp-tRNA(Asn)/Glu-tRNA(Gln) amidotransferase subunit GatC [Candidatus Brocadiia bacterium]|nr:MAG: Asp-tRNA(Asn)/Glu-tRNA(Gln) amidotransferase subunit GatC [Candidatus Brocadiia bacterium]
MADKIDEAQVRKSAKLSRLELTDDEVGEFAGQLNAIIGYVEKMNELNTEDVQPLAHCLAITNCLRDDVVKESLSVEKVLTNAPEHDEEFFLVPKIFDGTSSA